MMQQHVAEVSVLSRAVVDFIAEDLSAYRHQLHSGRGTRQAAAIIEAQKQSTSNDRRQQLRVWVQRSASLLRSLYAVVATANAIGGDENGDASADGAQTSTAGGLAAWSHDVGRFNWLFQEQLNGIGKIQTMVWEQRAPRAHVNQALRLVTSAATASSSSSAPEGLLSRATAGTGTILQHALAWRLLRSQALPRQVAIAAHPHHLILAVTDDVTVSVSCAGPQPNHPFTVTGLRWGGRAVGSLAGMGQPTASGPAHAGMGLAGARDRDAPSISQLQQLQMQLQAVLNGAVRHQSQQAALDSSSGDGAGAGGTSAPSPSASAEQADAASTADSALSKMAATVGDHAAIVTLTRLVQAVGSITVEASGDAIGNSRLEPLASVPIPMVTALPKRRRVLMSIWPLAGAPADDDNDEDGGEESPLLAFDGGYGVGSSSAPTGGYGLIAPGSTAALLEDGTVIPVASTLWSTRPGQVIAALGSSGRVTAQSLHGIDAASSSSASVLLQVHHGVSSSATEDVKVRVDEASGVVTRVQAEERALVNRRRARDGGRAGSGYGVDEQDATDAGSVVSGSTPAAGGVFGAGDGMRTIPIAVHVNDDDDGVAIEAAPHGGPATASSGAVGGGSYPLPSPTSAAAAGAGVQPLQSPTASELSAAAAGSATGGGSSRTTAGTLALAASPWCSGPRPSGGHAGRLVHFDVLQSRHELGRKLAASVGSSVSGVPFCEQVKPVVARLPWAPLPSRLATASATATAGGGGGREPFVDVDEVAVPSAAAAYSLLATAGVRAGRTTAQLAALLLQHRPDLSGNLTGVVGSSAGAGGGGGDVSVSFVDSVPAPLAGGTATCISPAAATVVSWRVGGDGSPAQCVSLRLMVDARDGSPLLHLDGFSDVGSSSSSSASRSISSQAFTAIDAVLRQAERWTGRRARARALAVVTALCNNGSTSVATASAPGSSSSSTASVDVHISSIVAAMPTLLNPSGAASLARVLESRGSVFGQPLAEDRDACLHAAVGSIAHARGRMLAALWCGSGVDAESVAGCAAAAAAHIGQPQELLAALDAVRSYGAGGAGSRSFAAHAIRAVTSACRTTASDLCDVLSITSSTDTAASVATMAASSGEYASRLDSVTSLDTRVRTWIACAALAGCYAEGLLDLVSAVSKLVFFHSNSRADVLLSSAPRFLFQEGIARLQAGTMANGDLRLTTQSTADASSPIAIGRPSACTPASPIADDANPAIQVWLSSSVVARAAHDSDGGGGLAMQRLALLACPIDTSATLAIRDSKGGGGTGSVYAFPHVRVVGSPKTGNGRGSEGASSSSPSSAVAGSLASSPAWAPPAMVQATNAGAEAAGLPSWCRAAVPTGSNTISLASSRKQRNKLYLLEMPQCVCDSLLDSAALAMELVSESDVDDPGSPHRSAVALVRLAADAAAAAGGHGLLILPSTAPVNAGNGIKHSTAAGGGGPPIAGHVLLQLRVPVVLLTGPAGAAARRAAIAAAAAHARPAAGSGRPALLSAASGSRPSMHGSGSRNLLVSSSLSEPVLHLSLQPQQPRQKSSPEVLAVIAAVRLPGVTKHTDDGGVTQAAKRMRKDSSVATDDGGLALQLAFSLRKRLLFLVD